MNKPKHKKLKIVLIVLLVLIAIPVSCYYAIGPRFYTDKTSNEKCLYYKFDSYYSLYGVNDKSQLEERGIVLGEKIEEQGTDSIYLAEDKYYNEVLVWDTDENAVVFVK